MFHILVEFTTEHYRWTKTADIFEQKFAELIVRECADVVKY